MFFNLVLLQFMGCASSAVQDSATIPTAEESEQTLFVYAGERPKNLLMISIDTWRHDQLDPHVFGDKQILLAPFVSNLEEEGVSLLKHHSSSSWTYPSMTAALSGQDLPTLGFLPIVGGEPNLMPSSAKFLPILLENQGYATALVTANGFLCSQYGIGNQYEVEQCLPLMTGVPSNVDEVTTRGLALVEDLSAEATPWFVHLHLVEPHLPYNSPENYVKEVSTLGSLKFDITNMSRWEMQKTWESLSPRDQELFEAHTKARYNAQTRHLNYKMESFFTDVANEGLLKDTLVVIFADHGEQLFEHGSIGHTATLHSQENNVRALFWAENLQPNFWASPTSHHDIVPTILEQLEIEIPLHITGVPAGKRSPDDVLFSYLLLAGKLTIAATNSDYKLMYELNAESKSLYDTSADIEEQNNIYEDNTEVAKTLWAATQTEITRLEYIIKLPDLARPKTTK